MPNFKIFYSIYGQAKKAGLDLTKEEVVSEFTAGRTTHLSELSPAELTTLQTNLAQLAPKTAPHPGDDKYNTKENNQRRKLIAIFKSIYGDAIGIYKAKEWVEKQGVDGKKKPFNDYNSRELSILISIAEKKVKPDHITSVINRLNHLQNA